MQTFATPASASATGEGACSWRALDVRRVPFARRIAIITIVGVAMLAAATAAFIAAGSRWALDVIPAPQEKPLRNKRIEIHLRDKDRIQIHFHGSHSSRPASAPVPAPVPAPAPTPAPTPAPATAAPAKKLAAPAYHCDDLATDLVDVKHRQLKPRCDKGAEAQGAFVGQTWVPSAGCYVAVPTRQEVAQVMKGQWVHVLGGSNMLLFVAAIAKLVQRDVLQQWDIRLQSHPCEAFDLIWRVRPDGTLQQLVRHYKSNKRPPSTGKEPSYYNATLNGEHVPEYDGDLLRITWWHAEYWPPVAHYLASITAGVRGWEAAAQTGYFMVSHACAAHVHPPPLTPTYVSHTCAVEPTLWTSCARR